MPSAVTISFDASFEEGLPVDETLDVDMPVRSTLKNALKRGGRIAADSLHVHHHHGHFHRTGKEAALSLMAENTPTVERFEAPRVELPIDLIILIVEEVNDPKTLAKLSLVSKMMLAFAQPRLYASIGICISDEQITMFWARRSSFHICHRHVTSRPIALEHMAVNSAFANLVKTLVIVDDRHKCVDVPEEIAHAITQMHSLQSVRWVSSAKTAASPISTRSPVQLPKTMRQIFERFEKTAPRLEEWNLEYPVQVSRSRDGEYPVVRIPRNTTRLEIKNAPNQEALLAVGRHLQTPDGRKSRSLTLEGSSTWKQAIKRAALSLVLPYNEDHPDDQLHLETLDLRRLLFGNSTMEKLPFHRIDRSALKHLRFGKCNAYGRIMDHCFSDELAPRNLESLHLSGYYDTCHRFWHTAPSVKTLSLALEADREQRTGNNILQYIHRHGDKLERLSLMFIRPNGTVVSSDQPSPDHEAVEERFLRAIAPKCTNLKEMALHMTFHSASAKMGTMCEIVSQFPGLTSLMLNTRSENDLSPCMPNSSQPEFYIGTVEQHRATEFVKSHTQVNGPRLRYIRIDDAFFKIHQGTYDNDFCEPSLSDPVLTPLLRDDMDEGCIPEIMLLPEIEGEADAWAIGCREGDDEELKCNWI